MTSIAYGSSLPDSATVDALTEIALDLRSSYHHAGDRLWERLDPDLWEATHNPWIVLQTVSRQRLQSVTADPDFQKLAAELRQEKQTAEQAKSWFRSAYSSAALSAVAYFSMEFMLSEALPIYSGGLGNVAGDQLKAASNLGVPVIGVGLLYQQGYFRQEISADGRQEALYPYNDPGQLPITPLRDSSGEWLRIALDFPGVKLWLRTWEAKVGRARLYLLDTNDPANPASLRGIAGELYGGDSELRIKQELVLGIGGWRLLRTLKLQPEVCHLNEGHAAFAVLERARSFMSEFNLSFEEALAITRAGNLFTTHTPVAAGFDRFAPRLMEKYLKNYSEKELGVSFERLLALGRQNPNDAAEPFNMAYLAIHGSGAVNAVSKLHGEVSRRLFQVLFPRWPQAEVPVTHVTNGVHMPTWDSADADRLWEDACGKSRWHGAMETVEKDIRTVPDTDLWQIRIQGRGSLVEYVRKRHVRQIARRGAVPDEIEKASRVLDADTLTLGFARRFAPYKRPNLLLHDRERLVRILTNTTRPVQLVIAGKAHPQDVLGQEMIREWIQFVYRAEVRSRAVFLTDYDVLVAEKLVQGVDVWLNTPRRPWEASGTSGMKVLVNGGLNLSELDGWWAEAYSPEFGWALGDGREHGDDPAWDAAEADALYTLLEREVIPQFYTRDERGIPRRWLNRMRESMSRLAPRFSTNRVVRQYTEDHYLRAAASFRERSANRGVVGSDIAQWQREIAEHWPKVHFGSATVQQQGNHYLFQVQVFVDDLSPDALAVELYADATAGSDALVQPMERGERLAGSANGFAYTARVPLARSAADFTPRIVPYHAKANVPLEAPFVLWHDNPGWR
jgi:glycogen phosphorylase